MYETPSQFFVFDFLQLSWKHAPVFLILSKLSLGFFTHTLAVKNLSKTADKSQKSILNVMVYLVVKL